MRVVRSRFLSPPDRTHRLLVGKFGAGYRSAGSGSTAKGWRKLNSSTRGLFTAPRDPRRPRAPRAGTPGLGTRAKALHGTFATEEMDGVVCVESMPENTVLRRTNG